MPSSSKSAGGSSEVPVVLCSASADHAPLKAIIESRVWLGQATDKRYPSEDCSSALDTWPEAAIPQL